MSILKDKVWLKVYKDETWVDFIERMQKVPHIQKANRLASSYKLDQSVSGQLQQFIQAKTLDKSVRGVEDLPKVIALLGVIQSYRETVSANMVGLMDMERHLRRVHKECESWLMLHPYLAKKKDGDRKRAVHLILQDLNDCLEDIEQMLRASEAAVWTLKQGADTFKEQRQGLQNLLYSGMGTGGNPEDVVVSR